MQRIHGEDGASSSYFNAVWRENHRDVVPKQQGDFMKCLDCTLYHDTLNGSLGIRPTVDPAVRAEAEGKRAKHLEVILVRCALCDRCHSYLRA